jgi:hypothetical protein
MAMFKCNMFPLLDTYMKALTHEEQVVPMRGTNIKPIHMRSRKHMEIRTLANGDVVYLDTWYTRGDPQKDAIVKWKENGEIHINAPMFNCVYEQLTSLLGVQFCREKNNLWVLLDNKWLPLHDRHASKVTVLKWMYGRLEYINPPTLTQKAINRGVAKAVRAKYQRIYDYIKGMAKLHESVYPFSEFVDAFDIDLGQAPRWGGAYWMIQRRLPKVSLDVGLGSQDDIVEMVSLANEGDLAMSHKLWLSCAWCGGHSEGWGGENLICAPNQAVKAFDNFILRLHREEVFYDKEVPTGKTPSTANEKFFR